MATKVLQFVSWYTDEGLVRNVLSSFGKRGQGQRMTFEDFSRLCVHTSSLELHEDEIQELFQRCACRSTYYTRTCGAGFGPVHRDLPTARWLVRADDCTKPPEVRDDHTAHISGWLETIGHPEYADNFLQQGFDTLGSVRAANLSEREPAVFLSIASYEGRVK